MVGSNYSVSLLFFWAIMSDKLRLNSSSVFYFKVVLFIDCLGDYY